MRRERENVRKGRERFFFLFLSSLFSKIYGNQTVSFCRRKKQSRSTHRELCVGTKILVFRQTPRGREFSYLCYLYPKGHLMDWNLLRGCERPQISIQNFWTEFRNFQDYFWTVQVEFLRLFLDNPG